MIADSSPSWHGRQHSAAKTNDYLFHQLIPYLGNKRKLLPLIQEAICRTGIVEGTFVDFFAGSGVVSRLAKKLGYLVIANDWEPYSHEINLAYVGCNRAPTYDKLSIGGVSRLFEHLNALRPVDGYVARHLCPRDDLAFDPSAERLFFTRSNGEKIDAIRAQLAEWERAGRIDDLERAFVLGSLLYAVSYVSNTSGVFKGFHRGWGGATGTALYRIRSSLRLAPPITYDNGRENRVTALDAQALAEQLADSVHAVDLAYLDPPYNQHPYGANYHVLNTVALGDAPRVGRTIGLGSKSAIRTDWRSDRRSAYNYRGRALGALVKLLDTIRARYILLSYSTDGIIPIQAVVEAACQRGTPDLVTGRYKRYRVSAQRYSARGHTVEFVLVIDTSGPPCPNRARALLNEIWQAGAAEVAGGILDRPRPGELVDASISIGGLDP